MRSHRSTTFVAALAIPGLLSLGCAGRTERRPRAATEEPAAVTRAAAPEAAQVPPSAVAGEPSECGFPSQETPSSLDDVEVIQPDQLVPEFRVATTECRAVGSDTLVGKRPLVIVFFSSWCRVCDKKMPIVRRAARELAEEVTFLGVALDTEETWPEVSAFVSEHGLDFPLIRGSHFQVFALGYNPLQSVPVVVVVGRTGRLVDLQIGYSPFDYNRLVGAIEVAKREAPEEPAALPSRDP